MNFDINWVAGLVAGVAAMIPGSIIYSPGVLGKRWMKEIGTSPEKMKAAGGNPGLAVAKMFVTSLVNGLVASFVVWTAGATTFSDAFLLAFAAVGWFWVSSSLMLTFFENRSKAWLGISALSHILTAAVIGVVLGLFV
ncbi:MAG TPA: DUF1761 domain-containing protein [Verrucomicrobiae bacterium]|nr:DUF1761 domain-containing protein [Verrucomicrobiae bacterium]